MVYYYNYYRLKENSKTILGQINICITVIALLPIATLSFLFIR